MHNRWWESKILSTALGGVLAALVTVTWNCASASYERELRGMIADYQRKLELKNELDSLFSSQRATYGVGCSLGAAHAYYLIKAKFLIRPQLRRLQESGGAKSTLERLERELVEAERNGMADAELLQRYMDKISDQKELDLAAVNVSAFFDRDETQRAAKVFCDTWQKFISKSEAPVIDAQERELLALARVEHKRFLKTEALTDLRDNPLTASRRNTEEVCAALHERALAEFRELSRLMAVEVGGVWPKAYR